MGMRTIFAAGMRPFGKELLDKIEPLTKKEKTTINTISFFGRILIPWT